MKIQLRYRLRYLFRTPQNPLEEARRTWSRKAISSCPYAWESEYSLLPDVKTDPVNAMPYVLHRGRRLYFPIACRDNVALMYNALRIEQDFRSSHCYLSPDESLRGETLLDVGCAEGVLTLDRIDEIAEAYLFECDPRWVAALECTFAPWRDRVHIIRKYVGDTTDADTVRLDDFFRDIPLHAPYLKMDIEGAEPQALAGATEFFAKHPDLRGAVCIYHCAGDREVVSRFLNDHGCRVVLSAGYLYYKGTFRPALAKFIKQNHP